MPPEAPPAVPPPTTGPTIAPTSSQPYNPATAPRNTSRHAPNPAITAALSAIAEGKPAPAKAPAAPQGEPPPVAKVEPPIPPQKDAKPPPQVTQQPKRFVPKDEVEPEPSAPPPQNDPTVPVSDAPKAPTPAAPEKSGPAQLREAYEKLKADFATAASEREVTKKELETFRSKAQAYEDRIKALEPVESRAKELEQKLVATDERLRVVDYLNHPEFHDKFVKPVADAMENAKALMSELVADPEGEPRAATMDDFNAILAAPSQTEAIRKAKELFGSDLAQTVVQQRRAVLDAQKARAKAQQEAATKSLEWAKSQATREAQQRSEARARFEQASKELATKFPDLYLPRTTDPDEVAARRTGEETAAMVILGTEEPIAQEAYLSKVAQVYHRAAAHPVLAHRLERANAEIESLKAKLAAYENSTPTTDGRKSSAGDSAGVVVPGSDVRARMRSKLEELANQGRR